MAGGWDRDKSGGRALLSWDREPNVAPQIVGTHEMGIHDLVFSTDGRYLALVSEDSMVQLWDGTRLGERQAGRILWPATSMRELPRIAFSPDGSRLATGDGFNDVVVVDVESGDLALPRMRGHGGIVTCVAYSPDGKRLASAGADDTVRLWDARTGTHVRTYLGHNGKINALAFSPDSRILASGARDDIKL